MRDILLTIVVFGSLLFILRRPYIGIYVWSWLSYMNPHRSAWGFAYYMPFAQIVAIVLFVAVIFSREKKSVPINSTLVVWFLFMAWMGITTLAAIYIDAATAQFVKIIKIQLLTFLTLMLIRDMRQLNLLLGVIVFSIGYYGVKGGVFTVLTGGAHRLWGPPDSFIAENNALGLATLMVIPLMIYFYQIAPRLLLKLVMASCIVFSLAAVLGSQSRGALVAILAVGFFYWMKTSSKLLSGILVISLAVAGYQFMPESWHKRMATIETYKEDSSAMGRIDAWTYSFNLANSRFTGGGLESWSAKTFAVYAPHVKRWAAAHSIYFGVLGDHGWVGLLLFLLILYLSWRNLTVVIRTTKDDPDRRNLTILARMLQVSLIAYMSGGSFLSLSYFDLPWHIIAVCFILRFTILEQPTSPATTQSLIHEEKRNYMRPVS